MAKAIRCSFCTKTRVKVKKMVEGPMFNGIKIYICNECIDDSYDAVHTDEIESFDTAADSLYTPSEIKTYLDDYVIGQDDAKVALSVSVYNHFKRINNVSEVELEKSNLLMIGPSGSGKTHLVKTVAQMFEVPYVIADATTLTEAGYVGSDVENLLTMLLSKADSNIELAQRGIIFIDEVDKIARKSVSSTSGRDISGEGVQQALLKLIEGTTITISKAPYDEIEFDTTDVLFIASGAFVGLEDIIKKNRRISSIGINADIPDQDGDKTLLAEITPGDLIQYGLITELVGRLPVVVTLNELTEQQLCDILTVPKNCLVSQFKHLFTIDGVVLEFKESYLRTIAKGNISKKTGARGLRTELEKTLQAVQFELPDLAERGLRKVIVNASGDTEYVYKQTRKKVKVNEKK